MPRKFVHSLCINNKEKLRQSLNINALSRRVNELLTASIGYTIPQGESWFLYKMVAQNTLRTYDVK